MINPTLILYRYRYANVRPGYFKRGGTQALQTNHPEAAASESIRSRPESVQESLLFESDVGHAVAPSKQK